MLSRVSLLNVLYSSNQYREAGVLNSPTFEVFDRLFNVLASSHRERL